LLGIVICEWNLSPKSHLFDAAIWGHFLALFRKKKRTQSAVFSRVLICSWLCRCVVCLDYI